MTSQLILANGFGVAIASDSAASYFERTYEDARKIRRLRGQHLLAVMCAGEVNLLGMPVIALVGQWEKSLATRLRSVTEYRDSFVAWLERNLDSWSSRSERDMEALKSLRYEIRWLRDRVQSRTADLPEEERLDEALRTLQEVHNSVCWDSTLAGMADQLLDRFSNEDLGEGRPPRLQTIVDLFFEEIPRVEKLERELHEYLRQLIGRSDWFPGLGEIVLTFVGYGTDELLPAVSTVELKGAIENHLSARVLGEEMARPFDGGFILVLPIAQTDIINLIIRGFDQSLIEEALTRVGRSNLPGGPDLESAKGYAEAQAADVAAGEPYTEFSSAVIDTAREMAWLGKVNPFYQTISKLELASLAEAAGSLVSVQNLSQNIHGELPTVGGPIDVATITLSEGFQWVRGGGWEQATPN